MNIAKRSDLESGYVHFSEVCQQSAPMFPLPMYGGFATTT